MCAENNCQLSTVNFPRVAHTHYARIPRPMSYVRFSALVADSVHGMLVVISREMWRVRGERVVKMARNRADAVTL